MRSLTVEDVLCVIGPDPVIRVMTDRGRSQGRVAGHDVKAALRQHVKGSLQLPELEVEPAGVPVRWPVRVPALVQGVSENLLGEADPAADEDPWQLFGFGVTLALSPPAGAHAFEGDGDVAEPPVRRVTGVEALAALPVVKIAVVQVVWKLFRVV